MGDYRKIIDVNCRGNLELVYSFGSRLAARGRGGIIVMSSMAGFQGSPFVSAYGASKAFLIALAEGAGAELKPLGVDVLACCPTSVLTPTYLASKPAGAGKVPLEMESAAVAREAIRALRRKTVVIPGFGAKAARFFMARVLSRRAAVSMMGNSTRAIYKP
jgi:uncharacterized protein